MSPRLALPQSRFRLAACVCVALLSSSLMVPAHAENSIEGLYEWKHGINYLGENGWEDAEGLDRLQLRKDGQNTYRVGIETTSDNGHSCGVYGYARQVGNRLEYRPTAKDLNADDPEAADCELNIYIKGGSASLEDVDGKCQHYHCGVRASLDGTEFERKSGSVFNWPSKADYRALEWQKLGRGLESGRLTWVPFVGNEASIVILRADPKYWALEGFASGGLTVSDWANKRGLVATFSAGEFSVGQQKHVGYFQSGKTVNNGNFNHYQSLAVYGPKKDGLPIFSIIDLDGDNGINKEDVAKNHTLVAQNSRLIKNPGINRWRQSNKRQSELALAQDREGRILVIFCREPLTMSEFNRVLLGMNIGIVAAQHLASGPEAQMFLGAKDKEQFFIGSFETEVREDEDNLEEWEIPVVMGLRPIRQKVTH